ncbi:hypothetical protein [Haliea salexigens]|uniref:hypothetical protein n=1 Tax=Haliea salexigens TaxID=287487 RepID=UPI00040DFAC8|nr:hypothetical protein [Haliea salexigens]
MKKVTVMAWCEVECLLAPTEGDFGDTDYVIESASPVKSNLMQGISETRKAELYEAVDEKLEDESFQAADPGPELRAYA